MRKTGDTGSDDPRAEGPLEAPISASAILADLRALGLREGEVALVHASLRAVAGMRSMVVGGAQAVLLALRDAVEASGTLVVPTFSPECSDPATWTRPPAPASWWPTFRNHLPAFDPLRTPSRGVGSLPELLRTWPGALRSTHPQCSFAALGPAAASIVGRQPLDEPFGEEGPLGALARLDARIVLLGVDYERCTAFHLAERRSRLPVRFLRTGAPVERGGRRRWLEWSAPIVHSNDFSALGASYEREGSVARGLVGRAETRTFRLAHAVAFATAWLEANR